ncbi:MAG: OmpA family protein, partial [Planctomycetota bacterium]
EMGIKKTENDVETNLANLRDGLVIHFDERSTFRPGSAQPSEELTRSLGEIGRVLEHYAYTITIEGFTDNAFQATPDYPTDKALGVARAVAAAEVLTSHSGLSPLLVQVAGMGNQRPLNENETPLDRRLNRRVELKIHSLSRTRAAALEMGG